MKLIQIGENKMSAIAGIYDSTKPASGYHGYQMMKAFSHFPCDDAQIWQKGHVFFGCHAQWITPESIGEQLPYYDQRRQIAITADAIIDNREELFDQLAIDRAERKVMSDSQLILHAYRKWGGEVPKYLIGDFAFMIWDEKKKKLFGARDFSGSRSLYYYSKGPQFAFCTLMEPLLKLPYINRQLNEEWLAEYLAISTLIDVVDVRKTPILDIQQVPPSHTITVVNGETVLEKYHVLTMDEKIHYQKDQEYVEAFKHIFQSAVDSRLRTFKSVGSTLSGGLDSSSVVSFAAKTLKEQNKRLHTYSSIPAKDFNDYTSSYYFPDERPFIRETVAYVGNITAHYLSFDEKNSYTNIDDWLETLETPYKFFENSFWVEGIFKKAQEDDVGILLTGAKGNFTISWGSAIDYYGYLLKRMKWIRLTKELKAYSQIMNVGRKDLLRTISKQAFPFLVRDDDAFPVLINQNFAARTNVFKKLKRYKLGLNGFTGLNIHNERNYLNKNEFIWNASSLSNAKLSLKYGLALRDPTNDVRVINYCSSLPLDQFVQKGVDRSLIRNATEGYLPDKVRMNQKYQGLQGMDWVHRMIPDWTEFIDEIKTLLRDQKMEQYFNMGVIKKALVIAMNIPNGEYVSSAELKILMRSLIVYRFLQSFDIEGGDINEKNMENSNVRIARY